MLCAMAAPVIIVVFLAASDASDPAAQAAMVATQDTLGPQAMVILRQVPANPADDAAVIVEKMLHASAVVELAWPDPDRHRARIRVHVAGGTTWTERELEFGTIDPPVQRGRAMALTIASMVPTTAPEEPPPVPPPAVPERPRSPPSSSASEAERPRVSPTGGPFSVDVVGLATVGVRDTTNRDLGGEAALRWRLLPTVSFRVALGVRFGEVPAARASLTTLRAGAGVAWTAVGSDNASMGLRADLVVLRHRLVRPGESEDARVQPAAALMAEGSWAPAAGTHLVAAVGVEQVFAASDVLLDGARIASLPRTYLVFELGLRARF
jgi:hypothetical protein